jgi:RNA polymerase sigma-70 factor (ECF subfamily)
MQDGFIKVFAKISQYSGKGSLEGWIRRIIINTALEKYRSSVSMYSLDDRFKGGEDLSSDNTVEKLNAEQILKLIQELSPKYRMVFNLYAIEGYSHKEISELLGITEGTSKSNLSRARVILQEKVKELFNIPREVK